MRGAIEGRFAVRWDEEPGEYGFMEDGEEVGRVYGVKPRPLTPSLLLTPWMEA
jgi:hypothetical protein